MFNVILLHDEIQKNVVRNRKITLKKDELFCTNDKNCNAIFLSWTKAPIIPYSRSDQTFCTLLINWPSTRLANVASERGYENWKFRLRNDTNHEMLSEVILNSGQVDRFAVDSTSANGALVPFLFLVNVHQTRPCHVRWTSDRWREMWWSAARNLPVILPERFEDMSGFPPRPCAAGEKSKKVSTLNRRTRVWHRS